MDNKKYTIIGCGAGGTSMGAVLAQKGLFVRMLDVDQEKVDRLNACDTLRAEGFLTASGRPKCITTDVGEAVDGADVILVVSTTDAHETIAHAIKPYIKEGQIIVLFPGHMGGALLFRNILCGGDDAPDLIIGEAADLLYPCRVKEIGVSLHTGVKEHVGIATVPAKDVQTVIDTIKPWFPNVEPRKSVIETSLRVFGVLHIIPTLLNVNKMDLCEEYDYYMKGCTPHICKVIEAAHDESCSVLERFGLKRTNAAMDLCKAYHFPETNDLYTAIQSGRPYDRDKSTKTLAHRFVHEELLSTFVPMASLGHELGVDTPVINMMIDLAQIYTGIDYRSEGRTVEKLGLKGMTVSEMIHFLSR